MNRLNSLATALAAAALFTCTAPTWAQTSTEGATSEGSGVTRLQEVVVTAQKRKQSASKTPVALSVVTEEELRSQGVTSASNLTELMPNTQFGKAGLGGVELSIRGIGSVDNTERGDPQVAFHIDGVYLGRPQGAGAAFYDLERVEVLRGPQGTLYGRNANAGAVNIITNKPRNVFEAAANADLGNFNNRKVDGMINVPINETLSLRAVVSQQKHDGYAKTTVLSAGGSNRDADDLDNLSGRLHALLKFTPGTTLLLSADTSRNKGAGQASYNVTSGQLPTSRDFVAELPGHIDDRSTGVSAEFNTDLGFADFTYLGSHRSATRDEGGPFGPAPNFSFAFSNEFKQDSHELRVNSKSGDSLQWLAGAYWFEETGRNISLRVRLPGGGPQAIRFLQDPAESSSRALFGQATYAFVPGLRGTLGLRLTKDKKYRAGTTFDGNDQPIGNVGNLARGEWSRTTYKAGVEYDLNPRHMLYASAATGYKAGGFNDGNEVVGDPNYNPTLYYKPESITSFEIGSKARYFDGRLQVNASAFYYDYTNLQLSSVVNNQLVTGNAGKAKVQGAEFEGRWAVSDAGRVNFALGLLDSKYTQYITPAGQDFRGRRLEKAPPVTLTLGYTHSWALADGAGISAYLGTRYSDWYVVRDPGTQTQAAREIRQPAFTKSDITLTYSSHDDRWNVQAYAKNIENKISVTGVLNNGGFNYAYLAEPRTLGVRAGIRF